MGGRDHMSIADVGNDYCIIECGNGGYQIGFVDGANLIDVSTCEPRFFPQLVSERAFGFLEHLF